LRTFPTVFVILIILLLGSFMSYNYIQGSTHNFGSQITSIEQSISNQKWDAAQQKLDETQLQWEKSKNWWTVLLDHNEIDTIDISFKRLDKYIVTQDLPLSLGELSTLELLFDHISDSEKLNLENIL
jgi:hypothetical protein